MQADSLREALGQVIANERREWRRERELIEAQARETIAELKSRIVEFEQSMMTSVSARLAALKDGEDGRSVSLEDVAPLIAEGIDRAVADAVAKTIVPALEAIPAHVNEAAAQLPKPQDGKDADPEAVREIVAEQVRTAVEAIPAPLDGVSVTVEDCRGVIEEAVSRAMGELPKPQDGKSITVEECLPVISEAVERAVASIPKPKDGKDGKMPMVRDWTDNIHYEGEVRTFEGGTYQAKRDTAKQPNHDDWTCLARPGRDGKTPVIRGTWSADGEYEALDVVMLGGASFVAKKDAPGACPGEGWQLMSSQGKRGNPGLPGATVRGSPIVAASVDDDGLLSLENGDGSVVTCDLYPLLSRL